MKAFILGAGLGTRLRPLTAELPKPLVPVFHRPLASYAMEHCVAAGVREFAVNTHYLPEKWTEGFDGARFKSQSGTAATLEFFFEEVLLETGGGLKNIESFVGDGPCVVYNGDILTDFPIDRLLAAHAEQGNAVTLGLRSDGAEKRVKVEGDRVVDLRGELTGDTGEHQFTGIYVVEREIMDLIPVGEVVSVMPAFWDLAKRGKLGACVVDDCYWHDLGSRGEYLAAHTQHPELGQAVEEGAVIEEGAVVENSVISAGAVIESGAEIRNSVIWKGAKISTGAVLKDCVVCSGAEVKAGSYSGEDLV